MQIFKLSQGEFVCAERLEAAYLQYVPAIQQIMVYGQPTCSALVAVVVPNYGALLARPEIRSKLAGIPNLPEVTAAQRARTSVPCNPIETSVSLMALSYLLPAIHLRAARVWRCRVRCAHA